ncbi:MAG: hypothetical protein GXO69_06140 [Acidobacteria bacterium]|nr:hypothetical protein [Acidobacteriota bacterium]
MLDRKDRTQHVLFIPGSLVDYIPKDHILKKVDKVPDLSWLREEVADCYDLTNGRPGIDPEAALRLMLAGFFQGREEYADAVGKAVVKDWRKK